MTASGAPRVMAAGCEFEDDDFYGNPFDPSSDEEDFVVPASRVGPSPSKDRGCTWGLFADDVSEEDILFGSARRGLADSNFGHGTSGSFSGLKLRNEPDSDDDTAWGDQVPDRELKLFLTTFTLKDEYKSLIREGIDLKKLLSMGESELLEMGFDGPAKLPVLRRLVYAISEAQSFDWIHHEAISMIDKFLYNARKLLNPPVLVRPQPENPSGIDEGPKNMNDLKDRVQRSLGSVYAQIVAVKPLLGFLDAFACRLKLLFRVALADPMALEEDLQETLVNANEITVTSEGLRNRLLELRAAFSAARQVPHESII